MEGNVSHCSLRCRLSVSRLPWCQPGDDCPAEGSTKLLISILQMNPSSNKTYLRPQRRHTTAPFTRPAQRGFNVPLTRLAGLFKQRGRGVGGKESELHRQ